jgi:hypothetical protein
VRVAKKGNYTFSASIDAGPLGGKLSGQQKVQIKNLSAPAKKVERGTTPII